MDNSTDSDMPSANIDSNLIGLDHGRRVGITWLTPPAQIALTNNRFPNAPAAMFYTSTIIDKEIFRTEF